MRIQNCLALTVVLAFTVGVATSGFAQVAVGVKIGKTEVGVALDDDDDDDDDPPPITVESFYDALEPYGRWVETVRYGWVWHPNRMPEDWRPYSYGYWECTEMGWVFVSDHPWGWACYHYGRWLNTPDNGWIWLPGTVWAPAWVAWRTGGEHIGWAPLPPDPHYHHASVVIVEEKHFQLDFVFVRGGHFREPARPALFVPAAQHATIINQTTNITQVNVVNNTVINNGPQISQVQKIVNKPVNVVKVKDVQKTEINNYHQNITEVAPEKAATLAKTATTVGKSSNSRVKKVQQTTPEVKERAALAVTKEKAPDDSKPVGRTTGQPGTDPKKSTDERLPGRTPRTPGKSDKDKSPDGPGREGTTKGAKNPAESTPSNPPGPGRSPKADDRKDGDRKGGDPSGRPGPSSKNDNMRKPSNSDKDSKTPRTGRDPSPSSKKDPKRPGSEKDPKAKDKPDDTPNPTPPK